MEININNIVSLNDVIKKNIRLWPYGHFERYLASRKSLPAIYQDIRKFNVNIIAVIIFIMVKTINVIGFVSK